MFSDVKWSMGTWRARASHLVGQWRRAHAEQKQLRRMLRDRKDADEIERIRCGAQRFPPMGF